MIKTIRSTKPRLFDSAVNSYLKDGWRVCSLQATKGDRSTTLIAFLEKADDSVHTG